MVPLLDEMIPSGVSRARLRMSTRRAYHMSGVRGRFETTLLPFLSRQLATTTR
jgi:hypothetical protein